MRKGGITALFCAFRLEYNRNIKNSCRKTLYSCALLYSCVLSSCTLSSCAQALFRCRSQTAVASCRSVIVKCDAERQKNPLTDRGAGFQLQNLTAIAIVGHLYKNMPFIVRVIIIAINYPNRIVHLQAVFKTQPGFGHNAQKPAVFHSDAYSRRQQKILLRFQGDIYRRVKIVSGRTGRCPGGKPDTVIYAPDFSVIRQKSVFPCRFKLIETDFGKFGYTRHIFLLSTVYQNKAGTGTAPVNFPWRRNCSDYGALMPENRQLWRFRASKFAAIMAACRRLDKKNACFFLIYSL